MFKYQGSKLRFGILFFLMMFFAVTILNAQKQNDLSKRLADILSLSDKNEQKYQLALFNEDFSSLLLNAKEQLEFLKPVKTAGTDDSRYQVFYYILRGKYGIDYVFFVRYQDARGEVRVHRFNQKIPLEQKEIGRVKDPEIRFSSRVIDGVKMYEMLFSDKGNPVVWQKYADLRLKCLFEEVGKTKDDKQKKELNSLINKRLMLLWAGKEYFDNDFPGLTRMKTIFSDDGKIKICTYGIAFNDFTNLFAGAVIVKKDDVPEVFELIDKTGSIRSLARSTLSNAKWFGAAYLDIIETKYKKKTYYTLLGYKGQDEFVKTRVIDVLWFAGGKPRFGAPIFKNDRYTYNRIIFKYSLGANMVLRYDEKKKMIVMDNLEPSDAMYKGVYRFYGPDFTYNGYKFEKGKWMLYKNVDLRNEK